MPREPTGEPSQGRGVLLLRGSSDGVVTWCHRGQVPVVVVPLPGWTAVLPFGGAWSSPPYADALDLLAARPVPSRLRTALGLFVRGERVLLSMQTARRTAPRRWLLWQRGVGLVPAPPLVPAAVPQLVAAARSGPDAVPAVRALLTELDDTPEELLSAVMAALDLPGAPLLERPSSDVAGGRMVRPSARRVAAFDAVVSEDAGQRAELEGR